ncbi:hypothetical protein D3C87_1898880 [compost metagenome]
MLGSALRGEIGMQLPAGHPQNPQLLIQNLLGKCRAQLCVLLLQLNILSLGLSQSL